MNRLSWTLLACVVGTQLAARTTGILDTAAAQVPRSVQAPSWPVAPIPQTVVGIDAGDPNTELAGVMGARRLKGGRLLIADSTPPQLRLYDADGHFLSLVGRRGSGPGEFRGRLSLYVGPRDSVLVFDDATNRWTQYSPTAMLVRSWIATSAERRRIEPAEYRRALIHPVGQPVASCYRTLLDPLPVPRDTAYREVFPDSSDRAWVRDERSPTWLVYSLTGKLLGRVTLPTGYDLLQIGDGFIVGTRRNQDGVQRVEVRAVRMPPHAAAPPCAARTDSFPHAPSPIVQALAIDLRNLESAGAAFRADYGHYPATYDSLLHASGFTLSPDNQVHWLNHGGEGWDAVARNPHTGQYCRILIGDISPTWLYRYAFCGP